MIAKLDSNGTVPGTPVRMLIVDDDVRVRNALRALVESEPNITVVGEAQCVSDVLECERILNPSLILLDLCLPRTDDGLRLLRLLTETNQRCVIAMCVHSSLRQAALNAHAQNFLDKGSAPDVILAAIRQAAQTQPNS